LYKNILHKKITLFWPTLVEGVKIFLLAYYQHILPNHNGADLSQPQSRKIFLISEGNKNKFLDPGSYITFFC
jgi:hypothetical protein